MNEKQNMRDLRTFTCTQVTVLEGEGTESSMARLVQYYFDGDRPLFKHDPALTEKSGPTTGREFWDMPCRLGGDFR